MLSNLPESLLYYHLPGSPSVAYGHRSLHDRSYRFWREFWIQVLQANGSEKQPNPDDFLRQTCVGVLEHRGEIVAMHAHCYFDLGYLAPGDHSYFHRFFTLEFFEELRAQGASRVLTMEQYSVLPKWRSPKVGTSLAAVMIALGVKLAQDWGVDAAIGIARADLGMDRLVRKQGAITVGDARSVFNTPCRQIAFFSRAMRPHPNLTVRKWADYFWNNRIDTTNASFSTGLSKAA